MKPVLILTKNILHESTFQQRIQQLNQEVFCSSELFQILTSSANANDYLYLFSIVVISETVGDTEFAHVLSRLKDTPNAVIRLMSKSSTKEKQKDLKQQKKYSCLEKECSLELLRDTLQSNLLHFEQTNDSFNVSGKIKMLEGRTIHFTTNERKFIHYLQQEPEKIHPRREVCYALWGKENNSTRSQLSCMTSRLNKKFMSLGVTAQIIETYWKKGYKLAPEFFEVLKTNNQFV